MDKLIKHKYRLALGSSGYFGTCICGEWTSSQCYTETQAATAWTKHVVPLVNDGTGQHVLVE